MNKLILIASLLLSACGGANLPDPTTTPFPDPPAELMRPAQTLKPLETNATPN